jgi:hypothetical protein
MQRSEEDLLIIELDDRLEFGSMLIDSDLEADTNGTACANTQPCSATNIAACGNVSACC